jgi:hypothetical protein
MTMSRVRAHWTGFPGGPGISTFYGASGPDLNNLVRTFFNDIKSLLPVDVTVTFDSSGDVLNEATGDITDTWSGAAPAVVVGTGAVVYGAPVGMYVRWLTSGIVNGHRVRGKTFIVPTVANYTSAGVANAAMVTTLQTAAGAFANAGLPSAPLVWSRPVPGGRAGTIHPINGQTVVGKLAVLRSRRD